jgi:hypothetical protein
MVPSDYNSIPVCSNHSARLESKGFTVVEGVVGFAVIPDPKHGAAVSSLPRPGVLFERLSKDAVKVADGPLRLLERMDVDISFRKTLTRKCLCFFGTGCVVMSGGFRFHASSHCF